MFGEAESESPRVPSPWDSLMSQSPSSNSCRSRAAATPSPLSVELLPKLVPESDDGNVEYKLQLLNPSPSRFARLVTQMKWRLLEGGGQAYYELGVADSGYLVGLPRADLERSLETLEMMAGEIGASVIVVKEVEVPVAMSELAAAQSDAWSRKRPGRRGGDEELGFGEESTGGESNTTETETSTTEFDTEGDYDDMEKTVIYEKEATSPLLAATKTDPGGSGSGAGNSHRELFVMDTDDLANIADNEEEETAPQAPIQTQFTIDLEISAVYKPRPMRTRPRAALLPPGKHHKRGKGKKHKDYPPPVVGSEWVTDVVHVEGQISTATSGDFSQGGDDDTPETGNMKRKGKEGAIGDGNAHDKAQHRRRARDRKREAKRNALLQRAAVAVEGAIVGDDLDGPWDSTKTVDYRQHSRPQKGITQQSLGGRSSIKVTTDDATEALTAGLEDLHVTVEEESLAVLVTVPTHAHALSDKSVKGVSNGTEDDWVNIESLPVAEVIDDDDDVFPSPTTSAPFSSPFKLDKILPEGTGDPPVSYLAAASEAVASHRQRVKVEKETADAQLTADDGAGKEGEKGEVRLIVEALVVRKMSHEEAFLDFGGFSLIGP
ncbi:hypothetical protein AX16_007068 [Volvariella volvacea WC 439]|nr:hypothetical protein AX16_007068 [Volvariella volvacea WC 439]